MKNQSCLQAIAVAVCLFALIAGVAKAQDEIFESDDLEIGGGHKGGHGAGHLGKGAIGGGGLSGMINVLRGNIGGLRKKESPLSSGKLEGSSATSVGSSVVGAAPSATAAAVSTGKEEHGLGHHGLGHHFHKFFELLFKPVELIQAIAHHFTLPLKEFVELLFKGFVFGAEVALSPLLVSIKIIEKVFVPDACRLKFMCHIGTHLDLLRESVLLFSPHFLEQSHHIKALTDGISGRDCESTFIACEPKLKEPFEKLKGGARGLSEVSAVNATEPIKASSS